MTRELATAVLLSGAGRTLGHLIARRAAGMLPARLLGVIASRPDAGGLDRARAAGIPVAVVDRRDFRDDASHSTAIAAALDPWGPEIVCLAGFLHRFVIPARYAGRTINIHPGPLPEFGGKGFHGIRVHEAVLAAGRPTTACTVHFCDDEYDHGPVILAREVPVVPGDTAETLAARVFDAECEAYPEALRRIASGEVPFPHPGLAAAAGGEGTA